MTQLAGGDGRMMIRTGLVVTVEAAPRDDGQFDIICTLDRERSTDTPTPTN